MSVPFIDMYRMHAPLEEVFKQRFDELLKSSGFIKGKYLQMFEDDFAKWIGTEFSLGVGSGHDGLVLALKGLGIGAGDKVIAPAMTFISTIEAIVEVGADIELVDVDENGLIDLKQAEKVLSSKKIKAIMPVHLYGKMVDPLELIRLKEKFNVLIIEDCAQAHGASMNGYRAGTIGDISEFSFYPGKNLGALGDGGAVCTNNELLYKKIMALREHGQTKKYVHTFLGGTTSRLDNLQAAFLIEKLKQMDHWNKQRQDAFRQYKKFLKNVSNGLVHDLNDNEHVFHLAIFESDNIPLLEKTFNEKNIGHGRHYPIPIHHMPCFKEFSFYNSKFPQAERFAYNTISLPIFPGITETEIKQVCSVIKDLLRTQSLQQTA